MGMCRRFGGNPSLLVPSINTLLYRYLCDRDRYFNHPIGCIGNIFFLLIFVYPAQGHGGAGRGCIGSRLMLHTSIKKIDTRVGTVVLFSSRTNNEWSAGIGRRDKRKEKKKVKKKINKINRTSKCLFFFSITDEVPYNQEIGWQIFKTIGCPMTKAGGARCICTFHDLIYIMQLENGRAVTRFSARVIIQKKKKKKEKRLHHT